MKEGGKEELSVDGRGRKRLSKVIRELSWKFEEGRESQDSQPGGRCRREGEDDTIVNHLIFNIFKIGNGGSENK